MNNQKLFHETEGKGVGGLNTKKYQAFLKVVDCGNLTRAAAELNYTQPAVSHMIRSLEEEFGFPLLLRMTDRVIPTAEGRRVMGYMRDILHTEQCMYEEVGSINQVEVGSIRIGSYFSALRSFLPELIQRYCERHPAVSLSLVEGNTQELISFLRDRTIDFAFATHAEFADFAFIPLLRDRLFAVLPEGNPLCAKTVITPRELCQYPLIVTEEKSDYDFVRICDLARINPEIKLRAKSEMSILSLVACKLGVAVIPELHLIDPPHNVVIRELDSPWSHRTVGIAAASLETLSLASKEFIAMLPQDFEGYVWSKYRVGTRPGTP